MNTKAVAALILFLASTVLAADKKILFVDSYHEGYPWSDGITAGIKSVVGDKADLKIFRMDTKNNPSDDFKKVAGEKAKAEMDAYKPDVVIAADDNAAQFLVTPFLKGTDQRVVFCGINWDASSYNFSSKTTCGMVEVALITPLIDQLKKYAKGDTVGYLSVDNETARKEAANYTQKFGIQLKEVYVTTVADWKAAFIGMQSSVNILILDNNAGIPGWDNAEIKSFVAANTKIPAGTIYDWMMPYCLFGYTKLPSEQGEWAAAAALRIIAGESPADIGVVQNKKGTLFVNMPIAAKMGAEIPLATLKSATVIK